MKKWKYELIIVVAALCIGLGGWWFVATKDERAEKAELEMMINFAQRQALEIAIIEQASKLTGYKQQMTTAQQQQEQALEQSIQTPVVPE